MNVTRSSLLSVKAAEELLNATAKVVLMKITLTDAGKRFNLDWIFRHLSYTFIAGRTYAITGPNGSGKSTLLQVIVGAMAVSEGKVEYELADGRSPMADPELRVPTNGHIQSQ